MRKKIIGLFMGFLGVSVLPSCDNGSDGGGGDSAGDDSNGSDTSEGGTDTTGDTDGGCEDLDGDEVCDNMDLCNEALGTHCMIFGAEIPGKLDDYLVENEGELGVLHRKPIQVGVTLTVHELLGDPAQCNEIAGGETARVYEAIVEHMAIVSEDPDAQAYIDETIMPAFEAEGAIAQIRFAKPPADQLPEDAPQKPMLDFILRETEPPAYTFRINDYSYSPSCENMTMGDTLAGDDAIYWIDWSDVDMVKDRVQGEAGSYVLRPHGGGG